MSLDSFGNVSMILVDFADSRPMDGWIFSLLLTSSFVQVHWAADGFGWQLPALSSPQSLMSSWAGLDGNFLVAF